MSPTNLMVAKTEVLAFENFLGNPTNAVGGSFILSYEGLTYRF